MNHNLDLEKIGELVDFNTGKKIEGQAIIVCSEKDQVILDYEIFKEVMIHRGFSNQNDRSELYCVGRILPNGVCVRIGLFTKDLIQEEFPQVYEYFHGMKA